MRAEPEIRRLVGGVLLLAVLLASAAAAAPKRAATRPALPAAQSPFASRLPAGEGRAIAERACVLCHSGMLITQQAKDSTGWAKTLGQMQKWGAPLSAGERDTLQSWLGARLGARTH